VDNGFRPVTRPDGGATNTALASWRAARSTTLTLSSGLVVLVRRVTIIDLAAQGRIPTPLLAQVEALVNGEQLASGNLASLEAAAPIIDLVARAALVSPPVADVADDDHISLDEIPILDRLAIYNWAQGEAAVLAPFPSA
jgi:hypothetical protein